MNYPIIDTHCHLYFPALDKIRGEAIQRAKEHNVQIQIQVGCDEISSLSAIRIAQKHDGYYATLGLHPSDVMNLGRPTPHRISGFEDYSIQAKNLDQLVEWFEQTLANYSEKIVAFGETGFDFHHGNKEKHSQRQKAAFLSHIKLAQKHEKTLIIHTREAREETLQFFEENKALFQYKNGTPMRVVVHCFCENAEFANIVTEKYGFYLGIGGIATYPKSETIREAIKSTPLKYLVTETDAPFLTPHKARKEFKNNEPGFLPEVVELIANIKEKPVQEVGEQLFENGKRLFNLK